METRIPVKGGNGHGYVSPDLMSAGVPAFPQNETERPMSQRFATAALSLVGSVVVSTAIVLAAWYGYVAKVDAHTTELQRLDGEVKAVAAQAKTKEAASSDMEIIATKLDAITKQIDSLDKRVERVELRQVGIPVDAPRSR